MRLDEGADTGALEGRLDPAGLAPSGDTLQAADRGGSVGSVEEIEAELEYVQRLLGDVARQRGRVPPEQTEYQNRALRQRRAALQRRRDALTGPSRPAAQAGPSDDLVALGTILPIDCSIDRNGLRVADKASITIDYRDAPFDPRLIRSCAVELIIGVVDAESYSAGAGGQYRDDGTLYSLVGRGQAGAPPQAGTTRFLGAVDEWTIELDGEGGDTISLACRDLTSILIDTPLPSGVSIDLSLPIDRGIRELLDGLPSTRGTEVVYGVEGEAESAPTPSDSIPPARRGRRGGRSARGRAGGQQINVWDHITEACVPLGLVPVFDGSTLRVINPRTFYEGRDRARRMIFGRNLRSLQFTRKLGGTKVPTIEVRSYDPSIGRTRWARYPVPGGAPTSGVFGQTDPPRPARANEVPPSGANPDDRILTQVVQGISDPATLSRAAESIWHQVGRQEIEGSFSTDEVASWEQPVEGVDLLTLNAGDPVELLVASAAPADPERASNAVSATELRGLQREARARYLESIGWSRRVAERFAALQDATSFQTVFRAQNVQIKYSQDSGVEVTADFINFLEVRELASTPPSPESPSPQVEGLTAGQSSAASQSARAASAERRLLTRQRELGLISDEEYETRSRELGDLEARRVGDVREVQS